MMRLLLCASLLVALVASVPMEDPLSDANDMLDHLAMDQPGEGRLGEGRSTDDDSDGEEDDDEMFRLPTEEKALKYAGEREDEDKEMAAQFKEADGDETMDLLKTEGGL